MTNYLIKVLTKYASKTDSAETTNSHYFWIDGIKIRVSDHQVDTDHDLAIYATRAGYICIPNNVNFRKVWTCTNTRQVLGVIQGMVFAKTLYCPTAHEASGGKTSFMTALNDLGCTVSSAVRKRLMKADAEVQKLMVKYLTMLESVVERQAIIERIAWLPNSGQQVAELNFKINQAMGRC